MRASRLTILTSLVIAIFLTFPVLAKKGGNGGGNGGGKPGGDPPAECTDLFPSFVYMREGGRNSEDVTYLASEDGCRSEPLPGVNGTIVHMTDVLADGPDEGSVKGVIVWKEDPGNITGNLSRYQVQRANFTVNTDGDVTLEGIQTLDLGDNALPPADNLNYFLDVWGDSTHEELYLVAWRIYTNNTTANGEGEHSLWIYNLNDPSDKRELYLSAQSANSWVCPPGTSNPEAVAGCYGPESPKWNPTGTALYLLNELYSPGPEPTSESVRWTGAVRLQISRLGTLGTWAISPPEIVYTGRTNNTAGEPGGTAARPRPEEFVCSTSSGHCDLILVSDDSNVTTTRRGMLDVEACVSWFNPPVTVGPNDWLNCMVVEDPYTGDSFDLANTVGGTWHGGGSWQSPDDVLHVLREKRRKTSVFRTNIHNGVSTKLVDDARFLDTGM